MNEIKHELSPIYNECSHILILGSFPSVKSRQQKFYYGHPQNRFWKVISTLYGREIPQTIEDKTAMLIDNNIALWDVLESCEIIGSSDSSIRNEQPVEIERIINACNIKAIYTNGGMAKKSYDKYLLKRTGMDAIGLPSTSPANAAWSLERLIESWKCIL